MVKNKSKRPDETDVMGAGDSQLDLSPPNVDEAQPLAGQQPGPAEPASSGTASAAPPAGASAGDGSAAGPPPGVAEPEGEAALRAQETEALRAELQGASDRYLRLAAEFDNYRKRVERERSELWGRAQGEIAVRLLDTLDDLERVAHHSESASAQTLLEGVQLIDRKLRAALAAVGVEEVQAEQASFDPRIMEAVAVVAAERPEEDDVVSDVFQRGYQLKGQLLRPARVRVKKHD